MGTTHMTSLNRRDAWQLLVVLALAAAVRCYQLGFASLWLDEALTIRIANLPLSELWVTPYDPTPPLYYTVIHFLLSFGHSEIALRIPSVLFGLLTVVMIYLATRKLAGATAAFAAALILALSFHNIEYSQEARAYSLLGLCLSVSLLGLINLGLRWQDSCAGFTFRKFLGSGGALYAMGLIAALYTHNAAVFYWLCVQLFFLAWWVRPFKFSLPCIASWAAVNMAVLLLWTPWLLVSIQMISQDVLSWLPQTTPELAFATWRAVNGLRTIDFAQPYADLLLAVAAIAGVYSLRRNLPLAILLFSLLILSGIANWAYGLVASPVFMLRTILWTSLIAAMLVAIGISRLPAIPGAVLLLLVLAAQAKGVHDYFNANYAENEGWRAVATVFNEQQRPGDILLIRQFYLEAPFFHYVDTSSPDWDIYGWDCAENSGLAGDIMEVDSIKRIAWRSTDLGPRKPIPVKAGATLWLIQSHCQPPNWTEADAVFFPGWRPEKEWGFKGIFLYRLVPAR